MKRLISGFTIGGWFLFFLTVVCVMSISSPVFSADEVIARLTNFSGTVLIKSQGSWDVKPEINLPLYSDDKVVTKIGVATLTFNDGAVMEIRPNSNLLVKETEEEEGIEEKVKVVKRKLRLFLGKMFFRTGRGSGTRTTLETTTMVCGLRGTEGFLSISADGQTYLQFTEGSGDTVGDFISGIATDVPSELANLNPVQRASFVAAAAASQASQAAEAAASGEISDADAALASAQAAEAAAQEAKAAAEAMLSNPDPEIQEEAMSVIEAADLAMEEARRAQDAAIESGATTGAGGEGETEGEGFDVDTEVSDYSEWGLEEEDRRVRDVIPPTILLSTQPALFTNSNRALFQFTVDDNITEGNDLIVSYKIDGGELVELEPPDEEELEGEPYIYAIDFSDLTERQHQIIITAIDEEGNVGINTYIWTTDYTAPVTSISTRPAAIANTSSFGFSATDANSGAGITYQYRLDGGTWTSTAASLNLGLATNGSADGSRTISVKATDAAGNTGAAVSYTWIYDTIAPVASIPTRPATIANTSSFGFSATDANSGAGITYQYSLNGGAWTTTSSALSLSLASTTGTAYTISVRATDAAGNTSTAVNYEWTYDTVAPALGTLSASYDGTGATLTASHTNYEPGTVTYTFYDGDTVVSNTGLGDGEYDLVVTAEDQAGNSSTSDTYSFSLQVSSLLEGSVYGIGSEIYGTASGSWLDVEGENVTGGGWETDMDGTWTGTHTGSLSLISGGGDETDGFWLSSVSGWIDGGTAGGESILTLLTSTSLSKGSGDFTGTFTGTGSGTWTGTQTGSALDEIPLDYSGYWGDLLYYDDGYHGFLLFDDEGYIDVYYGSYSGVAGIQYGLTGLMTRDQDDNLDLIALGLFEGGGVGTLLWNSPVMGGSYFGEYEGGYLGGYTGGFWREPETDAMNGTIEGFGAALIIDEETSTVSLIKGDVWGDFYPDINVWMAEGLMVPVNTYELVGSDDPWSGSLYAGLSGNFIIDGSPTGDIYGSQNWYYYDPWGYTIFVEDYGTDTGLVPFGVYDFKLGGGNSFSGKPEGVDVEWSAIVGGEGNFDYSWSGYWLAHIGSTWTSDGEITGDLWGTYLTPYQMGTIEGPFYGLYTGADSGTWVGESVGIYQGEPLTFSSDFSGYSSNGGLFSTFGGTYYESDFDSWYESYETGEYDYRYFLADTGTYYSDLLLFGMRERDNDTTDEYWTRIYVPYGDQQNEGTYLYIDDGLFTSPAYWAIGSLISDDFTELPTDQVGIWERDWYWEEDTNIMAQSGDFSGIMGGTGNLWEGADIYLMGEYEPWDELYDPLSLFRTSITSSEITSGGAYEGFLFGATDSISGSLYALYVKDDSSGGILEGYFSGSTYADLEVWEAEGYVNPVEKSADTGITPDSLGDYIVYETIAGWVGGDFGTADSFIENFLGYGQTISLGNDFDWGIFEIDFGVGNYFDNPEDSETWSARAGGVGVFGHVSDVSFLDQGYWLTDEITGTVSEGMMLGEFAGKVLTLTKYMDLTGEFIGTYDETGDTWQAMVGGYWDNSQPVYFVGHMDGDSELTEKRYGGYGTNPEPYEYFYYGYDEVTGYGWSNYEDDAGNIIHTDYSSDGYYEYWTEDADGNITGAGEGDLGGTDLYTYLQAVAASYDEYGYNDLYYNLSDSGWMEGLMGGLEPIWTATESDPADVVIIGQFDLDDEREYMPAVFSLETGSWNPYDETETIWDGGTSNIGFYRGYMKGLTLSLNSDDSVPIEGDLLSLYLDDSGNIGFLKGAFTGTGYSDARMWEGTGSVYPLSILSDTGLTYDDIDVNDIQNWSTLEGAFIGFLYADGEVTGSTYGYSYHSDTTRIQDYPLSVATVVLGGRYIYDVTPDEWSASFSIYDGTADLYVGYDGTWTESFGTNIIEADAYQGWVDLNYGVTGVSGGKLIGTFDPDTSTWQTVISLASMDTGTFLDMVQNNQDALEALNIPYIEVGRTDLSGSGGVLTSVTMDDVTFFRYSDGTDPKIWATGSIDGETSAYGIDVNGSTAILSGTGFDNSVTFTVNNYGDVGGTWDASVVGTGTVEGNDINITGGAAGTVDTDLDPVAYGTTFSGTGAGVVTP